MPEAIFIIVLHASVFGMSGVTLSDDPRHQTFYASIEECRKAIPKVRRQVHLPQPASLDSLECRKMEIAK